MKIRLGDVRMSGPNRCPSTKREGKRSWVCQLKKGHKTERHASLSGHRSWPKEQED